MKVNIKFKVTYFLIAIIFALFTSTYHLKHAKPSLTYEHTQTNIILLHESEPIQNYISSEINHNNTNEIVIWRDLLPTIFTANNNLFTKIPLLEKIKNILYDINNHSILTRYKTRVLRI